MAMIQRLMDAWKDTYTVRRVFGDAIEKDGLTVIPVAMVTGGGGGGSASAADEDPSSEGEGGGFGGMARPVGVYVVRADSAEWQPAVDVTVLGLASIILAALIAVVLGRALGRRR